MNNRLITSKQKDAILAEYKSLKGCSKAYLLEQYNCLYRVNCATIKTPKADLVSYILYAKFADWQIKQAFAKKVKSNS